MIGKTYSVIIILAFIFSAITGNMEKLGAECISGAVNAVKFMIELGTMMGFWCGIMAVFEKCGVLAFFTRIIRPILKPIFPKSAKDDSVMGDISMNVGANFLGLGNAATPAGISAMQKMNKQVPNNDEMVMLTVLNTASVQFIPTTLLSLRIIAGSHAPYEVIPLIWICSVITVLFAILITKGLGSLRKPWKE